MSLEQRAARVVIRAKMKSKKGPKKYLLTDKVRLFVSAAVISYLSSNPKINRIYGKSGYSLDNLVSMVQNGK